MHKSRDLYQCDLFNENLSHIDQLIGEDYLTNDDLFSHIQLNDINRILLYPF